MENNSLQEILDKECSLSHTKFSFNVVIPIVFSSRVAVMAELYSMTASSRFRITKCQPMDISRQEHRTPSL
jgi:hypothetical protein